jgi:GNAT superfamily N-acetyltransferase
VGAALAVEELREADVAEVARLLGHLFEQEADFVPDPALQERALRRVLDDPALGVVLVAHLEGRIVGTVMLLRTVSTALGEEVCWLEDFVVEPKSRGAGIGHTLLDAAVAEARRRKWVRISLLTDEDNAAALRLYAHYGFSRSRMVPLRCLV